MKTICQPQLLSASTRSELQQQYLDMLLKDILPFWFPRAVDREHGGYLHCFDRDGTLVDTDKSVWAQGRMAWMLFTLFNTVEQNSQWRDWGTSGIEFLEQHCFDTDGRMFFHVARDGKPIRKRRYAYSETFASVAYAAGARTTGNSRWAERAIELFRQFIDWNSTPGLQPAKFTAERPLIGLGPRMITIVTAQELQANLGEDDFCRKQIDRCLDDIEHLFMKPELEVVMENVTPDGKISDHFDGRTLNPGHAIEASWFLLMEARHRGDGRLKQLGLQILDWMWARGWDEEYGGLFYFRDVYGKPVQEYWHEMKFWWPHDEALIATLLAWTMTGNPRYAAWHQQMLDWSLQNFADPEYGEWYGYLNRDGSRSSSLKGSLWKSFFHHPRMAWMCWMLLRDHTQSSLPL